MVGGPLVKQGLNVDRIGGRRNFGANAADSKTEVRGCFDRQDQQDFFRIYRCLNKVGTDRIDRIKTS